MINRIKAWLRNWLCVERQPAIPAGKVGGVPIFRSEEDPGRRWLVRPDDCEEVFTLVGCFVEWHRPIYDDERVMVRSFTPIPPDGRWGGYIEITCAQNVEEARCTGT